MAASRSTLSTPIPALPITLSFLQDSITSLVALVADLTTKLKTINQILEKENIAYDVNSYRTAPAGFRIWGGATVESTDIEKLLPWIKWAYLTNLNV